MGKGDIFKPLGPGQLDAEEHRLKQDADRVLKRKAEGFKDMDAVREERAAEASKYSEGDEVEVEVGPNKWRTGKILSITPHGNLVVDLYSKRPWKGAATSPFVRKKSEKNE